MTRRGRLPAVALGAVLVAGTAGGVTALALDAPTEWAALLLAAGLAASAALLQRGLDGRARAGATELRRLPRTETEVARQVVERRPVLLRAVFLLAALTGAAAVGWLWRFGPRRARGTGWADGVRCVGDDGRPVLAEDLPAGGIVTVWPEGHRDEELAAVVVLRVIGAPVRASSTEGLLAYSRICTHAGCPVALFRAEDSTLYCPCHQATFDALDGARPVFGPASRPLPRLPLGTDAGGFLVARGDLSAPPGPYIGGRS